MELFQQRAVYNIKSWQWDLARGALCVLKETCDRPS